MSAAPARGALAALAGLTKFAPLALAPLLARGTGPWPRKRWLLAYVLAFVSTGVVVLAPVLLGGDFGAFWRHTIVYQAGRSSPFSVWGLWGGLSFEQHVVQGAAAMLAVVVAFVPRRRTMIELAALGAGVLIALQLGVEHWFYLYIVWFFPLVMVAVLGANPAAPRCAPSPERAAEPEPLLVGAP